MKTVLKNAGLAGASILALAALLLAQIAAPSALMRAISSDDSDVVKEVNPPPFDFNDDFYKNNGIDLTVLNSQEAARFGRFRRTGPPAPSGKSNWVMDDSNTSPIRNNVRILATTGAYRDDVGTPNQFISIIAFANNQPGQPASNFFSALPDCPLPLVAPMTGCLARGIPMEQIVGPPNGVGSLFNGSAFEAYAGLKQVVNGTFRSTPCASIGTGVANGNCFPVILPDGLPGVVTSNLRQDWRVTTNRSVLDGSASFSYFGDNLLGMWIITYFWYIDTGFGPHQTLGCKAALDFMARRNGLSLDGTPIVKSGDELHFLENNLQGTEGNDFPPPPNPPCATEGNLDASGADPVGAVWLICPAIPDPTRGGIAKDAFVDTVRRGDGSPLDPQIAANFNCLQQTGKFCTLANGTYAVENPASHLLWDGLGSGVALNARNGASDQEWTFNASNVGTYTITQKSSGLVLDDPRHSLASGTQLVLSSPSGAASQKWIVTPLTDGYRVTNLLSKLAVDAADNVQGTSILQATPTGESGQVWAIRIDPVGN